jgi:hypothetical protein
MIGSHAEIAEHKDLDLTSFKAHIILVPGSFEITSFGPIPKEKMSLIFRTFL